MLRVLKYSGVLGKTAHPMGWAMVAYGLCVGLATIYGRYHFAVDAAAGIAASCLGLAAVYLNKRGA